MYECLCLCSPWGEASLKLRVEQPHEQHHEDDCHGEVAEGDGDGYPQGRVGKECCQLHTRKIYLGAKVQIKCYAGCINSNNGV